MGDLPEQQNRALRSRLESEGVRYLLASYSDLHGAPKSKCVPIAHLEQMMRGSELFTGAALDGVPQAVNDEEVAAHPDPESLLILPWQRDTAWFASDLYCAGRPFEACNRGIFKSVLADAAEMGFLFNFGIEPEFFLLQTDEGGSPVPIGPRDNLAKPAYDVKSLLDRFGVIEQIVSSMNELGYDVYSFDHEDGNGQYEIDFTYSDGLTMADRFVFFRLMVSEIANKCGYFASFMPKPFPDRAGSGAHYNMSLANIDTGENVFPSDDDRRGCGVSKLAYHFIGGLLAHLPAICAVTSPTVNSYKRLIKEGSMSGLTWAPIFACFGNNNRTNALRIPLAANRVEMRSADIANNPYLGGAMALAAGLEGIRNELDPGDPHTENMYEKSDAELRRLGIRRLPQTLGEALDALEADPLTEAVLGPAMKASFLAYKRAEWASYTNHVSDWELERYLKFL